MLLFELDERAPQSKSWQIVKRLLEMMKNGALTPGDRLPSTRKLAELLRVHRSTVALAYQTLWSLGYVELRRGTAPVVRCRVRVAEPGDREPLSAIDWSTVASPASEDVYRLFLARNVRREHTPDLQCISFEFIKMDPRLFPAERFRASLGRVFRDEGLSLLGYGDAQGYEPLREAIAVRMRTHGISVTREEIVITNGAQHALDLVLRMTARPERTVAVESPCYGDILPLLKQYGLNIAEIPMNCEGMDLDVLEDRCRKAPLHLIYTMPNFQNPTGITTDQAHRERLLSICSRYEVPLLEDAFEEEMKYSGRAVLPVKSMDSGHRVIYCGTFSKVLFPGIRVGWAAAHPECIRRLTALRRYGELAPPGLLQAALARFCSEGWYEKHISMMHRVYRKRMQTALAALERFVSPEWASWTKPAGGYLIWLSMAPHPPVDWEKVFASEGVAVASGRSFFSSDPAGTFFRLSISSLNEAEIEEGIRRLGKAFQKVYDRKDIAK